jgi:hypothetical protein
LRRVDAPLARRFKGNAMSWELWQQELNWDAPWVDVCLRVELPFWLMINDTTISIEVGGHTFPVALHGETFELHGRWISDSKQCVAYQGPLKNNEDLSENIQKILRENPDLNILWRKCKTVLKITTRCNEDVWNRAQAGNQHAAVSFYLEELCRAHIPVVNRLIQGYRLATYDYFAFEVAPWDVPYWHIERGALAVRCILVPYRGWDHRPMVQFIEGEQLQNLFTTEATPGEFELLDALNLIERGDYSGAVRRVTTAIEVVVEAVLERALITAEGKAVAAKFLKDTRRSFHRRVTKYESLSGRTLSQSSRSTHEGYRIASAEHGRASKALDTGRWTFNWFENDDQRRAIREKRIALRSMGRDMTYGIFGGHITCEGVILTPLLATVSRTKPD